MNIVCPRCQFRQPQDKFCAKCGLDIETYVPPHQSASSKFLKNHIIHGLIIFMIASSVGFYLYRRHRIHLQQRADYSGGPQFQKDTEFEDIPESEDPKKQLALAATTTSADAQPITAVPTGEVIYDLTVEHFEIEQKSLEKLFEISRQVNLYNSFGDYAAGVLPDLDKNISKIRTKSYGKAVERLQRGQVLHWSTGLRKPDQTSESGLEFFLEWEEKNQRFEGNLEIQRVWHENDSAASPYSTTAYPAHFEIGPQTGFYIAGVLPHTPPSVPKKTWEAIPLFKIFESAAFRKQTSDHLILFSLTKKDSVRQVQKNTSRGKDD